MPQYNEGLPFFVLKDKKLKDQMKIWLGEKKVVYDEVVASGYDRLERPLIFLKLETRRQAIIICGTDEIREIARTMLEGTATAK